MNSSGSSGMTRTSSEESEVSSVISAEILNRDNSFACEESSADDDFEFNSIMNTRSSNPFGFGSSKATTKTSSAPDPTSYVAIAAAGVNRIAELLHRLQAAEDEIVSRDHAACYNKTSTTSDQGKDKEIVKETLRELGGLRQRTLCQIPVRHRQRLTDHVERSTSSADCSTPLVEFTSLYGRCFNLSMNLKILAGNGSSSGSGMDATLATRILSDLRVIETSMTTRVEKRDAIRSDKLMGSLMSGMRLERATDVPTL